MGSIDTISEKPSMAALYQHLASNDLHHSADDLITLFFQCFAKDYRCILVPGAEQPLYLPASTESLHHQIFFTRDYFASALHEVSHWCLAGDSRRKRKDYGYWYTPEPRTLEEQLAFFQAEIKPQATEWLFSACAGSKFRVSIDNFDCDISEHITAFKDSVYTQVVSDLTNLSSRVEQFAKALSYYYQRDFPSSNSFQRDSLDVY